MIIFLNEIAIVVDPTDDPCNIMELISSCGFNNCLSDFIFMCRVIYGFCIRFFSVHPAPVHHMLGPARLMIVSVSL